mmetsp:Transcript_37941/g.65434  ORF Transcript_37941/g.65434 Transcript_37941/m.65434 type:complete len:124 (+) Transcript_37941:510-881(+)
MEVAMALRMKLRRWIRVQQRNWQTIYLRSRRRRTSNLWMMLSKEAKKLKLKEKIQYEITWLNGDVPEIYDSLDETGSFFLIKLVSENNFTSGVGTGKSRVWLGRVLAIDLRTEASSSEFQKYG